MYMYIRVQDLGHIQSEGKLIGNSHWEMFN